MNTKEENKINAPMGGETMSSAMADAVNYHRWILDLLRPWVREKKVLEIGAGLGQYTQAMREIAREFLVTDLDPDCLKHFNSRSAGDTRCVVADLLDPNFASAFGGEKFDAVVCLNVLEHLQDDAPAIANLGRILTPGGMLLLQLPAHRSCFGPMDTLAGHFRRYRRLDIRKLFTVSEWTIHENIYMNPVGAVGWFLNARFCKPKTLSDRQINRQILFFDRYLLPLSKKLTPITKDFLGQSIWARVEKK